MTTQNTKCELCGEPMPEGEQMFKYHGYSGPCPKPMIGEAKPASGSVSDDADQARAASHSVKSAPTSGCCCARSTVAWRKPSLLPQS